MAVLFTEASSGSASDDGKPAFRVDNRGEAAAIWAESSSNSNATLVGINRGNTVAVWAENTSNGAAALIVRNNAGGEGLRAETNGEHGAVVGINNSNGHGVFGISESGEGVHGETKSNDHAAVVGVSNGNAFAIHGIGTRAALFQGDVEVTGDIRLLGADCAEEFDVSGTKHIEPGTVMVLDNSGNVQQSYLPYDKKVAGVVSGAGTYKPALILDKKEILTDKIRLPIALMGKVYCKVDATVSPIEIGDMLTTSTLEGHAMKAEDPYKAFGSVIGKALGSLKEGIGTIPVLVALQ